MAELTVSRDVAVPPSVVWALVADLTRMPEWSPENETVTWLGGASEAALGARFKGTNRNGSKKWSSVATITEYKPGRTFEFRTKAGPFNIADWSYSAEPSGDGCRVTEGWTDRRGRVMKVLSRLATGVDDRPSHNREGMEETLRRLAAAAETSDPG